MSGHSKWSKVKHQKEATDAAKGKVFTKYAATIMIAVREGGGPDPASNFKLRLVVEKAKGMNMPKDNITRAIEKGAHLGKEGGMENHIYEAFGPGGVGIIIETATDNKQRTVSELKNILDHGGGSLAGSGSVSHFFNRVGYIEVKKNGKLTDDLFEIILDAGADDIVDNGETIDVYTKASSLHTVKEALDKSSLHIGESDLIYRPTAFIPISDPGLVKKTEELLIHLEDHDDVHHVYANCEIK